jgi:hypothetical protein
MNTVSSDGPDIVIREGSRNAQARYRLAGEVETEVPCEVTLRGGRSLRFTDASWGETIPGRLPWVLHVEIPEESQTRRLRFERCG